MVTALRSSILPATHFNLRRGSAVGLILVLAFGSACSEDEAPPPEQTTPDVGTDGVADSAQPDSQTVPDMAAGDDAASDVTVDWPPCLSGAVSVCELGSPSLRSQFSTPSGLSPQLLCPTECRRVEPNAELAMSSICS